jgi:hypothetical protein
MKKNIAAWRLNKKCPFLLDHYINFFAILGEDNAKLEEEIKQ